MHWVPVRKSSSTVARSNTARELANSLRREATPTCEMKTTDGLPGAPDLALSDEHVPLLAHGMEKTDAAARGKLSRSFNPGTQSSTALQWPLPQEKNQ